MFACENYVNLASDNEEKALSRATRGVARALTGDFAGAIADFEAYVPFEDEPEEYRVQREQWIKELKEGKNPFTDEVLEELKS